MTELHSENVDARHLLVEEFDHTADFRWQFVCNEQKPDMTSAQVLVNSFPLRFDAGLASTGI